MSKSNVAKAVLRRQKSLTTFDTVIKLEGQNMLEELEKILAQDMEDGDNPSDLPRCLHRRLKRLMAALQKADDACVKKQKAELSQGRRVRKCLEGARQELLEARRWLRLASPKTADRLMVGVPSDVPRFIPEQILRMINLSVEALENPKIEVKVQESLRQFFPRGFNRQAHADRLRKKARELQDAKKRFTDCEVATIRAVVAKKHAKEAYDQDFPEIAQIFVCLFRLSGNPEFESSLKPSRQEPGLLLSAVKLRRAILAGKKTSRDESESSA